MVNPLRAGVLLAPFLGILFLIFAAWAGLGPEVTQASDALRQWTNASLGWAFLGIAGLSVVLVFAAYMLLDGIRIGGPDARPSLGKFAAIAVGVAASTSLGLLFWAAAEPVYHAHQPPRSFGLIPQSEDARLFARAATYLHWSLTVHALSALFMVAFGIASQNLGRRPSLGDVIFGASATSEPGVWATILDGIAVFCVTLLAASGLASCILALSGEMARFGPFAPNAAALFALALAIVFVVLMAGARPIRTLYSTLARWSLILMLVMTGAVIVLGPTSPILADGFRGLWQAILSLPKLMSFTGYASSDPWPQTWTMTHWASAMILAPLVGLFLSRAARGFSIDDAILWFAAVPALISILWVAVLGGLALSVDEKTGGGIWTAIQRGGADDAAYTALWTLRGGDALLVGFVALVVLSFAGFAAAILHAMMRMCAPGEDALTMVVEARQNVALIWCAGIGLGGWGLASLGGGPVAEAVARAGGLPALFITLGVALAVLRYCFTPRSITGAAPREPMQIDLDFGEDVTPVLRRQGMADDADAAPVKRVNKRRKSA